jgi:hypothetical protein
MISYKLNQSGRTGVRLPSGARGFFSSPKRQERLWVSHQPPNGVLPRRGKVPSLKISEAISLRSLHSCMAWTGINLKVFQDGRSTEGASETCSKTKPLADENPWLYLTSTIIPNCKCSIWMVNRVVLWIPRKWVNL